jgi:hypothetical protein
MQCEMQTANLILVSALTFVSSHYAHTVEIHMQCVTGMNCLLWFVNTSTVQHRGFL